MNLLTFDQNIRTVYLYIRAVYPYENHVTTHTRIPKFRSYIMLLHVNTVEFCIFDVLCLMFISIHIKVYDQTGLSVLFFLSNIYLCAQMTVLLCLFRLILNVQINS